MLVWIPHWKRSRQWLPGPADAVRTQRRSPWRHPIGWQVSLFFAAHSLVFYALIDWYASYAASRGIAAGTSGVYLLVYQVVAVATNLASASLIGRSRDQTRLGLAWALPWWSVRSDCCSSLPIPCSGWSVQVLERASPW